MRFARPKHRGQVSLTFGPGFEEISLHCKSRPVSTISLVSFITRRDGAEEICSSVGWRLSATFLFIESLGGEKVHCQQPTLNSSRYLYLIMGQKKDLADRQEPDKTPRWVRSAQTRVSPPPWHSQRLWKQVVLPTIISTLAQSMEWPASLACSDTADLRSQACDQWNNFAGSSKL